MELERKESGVMENSSREYGLFSDPDSLFSGSKIFQQVNQFLFVCFFFPIISRQEYLAGMKYCRTVTASLMKCSQNCKTEKKIPYHKGIIMLP